MKCGPSHPGRGSPPQGARARFLGLALLFGSCLSLVRAQQLPAAREAPTAATSPAPKASGTQPAAESKPAGDGELLSFDQSKVSAQMSELEERMFRLAESLRELEPENSSRLRLGLRYAREELILHQMQLAQEMLSTLKLTDAVTEEK
ncbi:MAG: hypothetical protein HY000_33205, partial [Planctomycetes bacterium]|nr:hypothetical protein [Planctomycetota bacterium]